MEEQEESIRAEEEERVVVVVAVAADERVPGGGGGDGGEEGGEGRAEIEEGAEEGLSVIRSDNSSVLSSRRSGDDDDDDNDHDGDDDDSSTGSRDHEDHDDMGGIIVRSRTLRETADLLENGLGPPIRSLARVTTVKPSFDDADDNNVEDGAPQFRRFVAALGRGGRTVRHLELTRVRWYKVHEEDVEQLCRDVIPNHPTVVSVATDMPSQYVTILATSLKADTANPLRQLTFKTTLDQDAAQAIADMVRRDVPITGLDIGPALSNINYKIICQAVSRSAIVRRLRLDLLWAPFDGVDPLDTLDDVLASTSLRKLSVHAGSLSDHFVERFTRQLRINASLESLTLIQHPDGTGERKSPFFGPIADVMETYNVSLQTVKFNSRTNIFPALAPTPKEARVLRRIRRRNRRIRRAVEQLEIRNYVLEPTSLWPDAFGMVSSVPTLVYRYFRRGYVNAMFHSE